MRGSLYWGKIISLGIILGVGIQFAEAWTNPITSAPGGNVPGPINTGIVNQVKNASLGLVGNLSAWMIQPNALAIENTVCPVGAQNGLMAKNAAGVILSCQSGIWKKASSGAVSGSVIAGCGPSSASEGSDSPSSACWGGAVFLKTPGGPENCPAGSIKIWTDFGTGFHTFLCIAS